MKLSIKSITTILLLATTQYSFSSEIPKAPTPGDHILNPANRKELLKNINTLETNNELLTGHKRPDMAKLSNKLNKDQKTQVVNNMVNLYKLDKMHKSKPKKPIKRSWSSAWLNLPLLGYYLFMDQEQQEVYNYTKRQKVLDAYSPLTHEQSARQYNAGNLNNLREQQSTFSKTKTYKMAVKQLAFYDQIAVTKSNTNRAAYAYHMELAIQQEKIDPENIENFLRSDFQKRDSGYTEITPLSQLTTVTANEYIEYYLQKRNEVKNLQDRLMAFDSICGDTIVDTKNKYAAYMERTIQRQAISENNIEAFLKNNFINLSVVNCKMGTSAAQYVDYYLQIHKVYDNSTDRVTHFKQSYDSHGKVVSEIDELSRNYKTTILPKYLAIYRGIDEKAGTRTRLETISYRNEPL